MRVVLTGAKHELGRLVYSTLENVLFLANATVLRLRWCPILHPVIRSVYPDSIVLFRIKTVVEYSTNG